MNTGTHHLDLQLPHRSIFNVPDASGVQITCRTGSVWITLDNDPRDIVLQAGESYTGTDHRQAIIYALDASQLVLTDNSASAASVRSPAKPVPAPTRTLAQAPA
jgi:Protein of unknown function (DUF2917)